MTNILVTGSNGQLGSEIKELSSNYDYNFFFTERPTLDITDATAVKIFVEKNKINTIINCAAYTAVDKAESDEVNADKINHLAVKYLAEISREKNIKLIHISTDYVFEGINYKPYKEEDTTNPNGVYGATKLAGEKALQAINPSNAIIIRTSWVYSSYGANFVKTMLRLGREKESLGVIFDQVGTPTYARDLARAILDVVDCHTSLAVTKGSDCRTSLAVTDDLLLQETSPSLRGTKQSTNVEIYNYSNEGVCSWYDFAKEIMKMAKLECIVNPIETKEYLALNAATPVPKGKVGCQTPAQRPHFSLLNKSKIKREFNITIPYWKDSLDECLTIMGERK